MLSSFSVQNYRSILDLKLDFTYGEGKAPNHHEKMEVMPFIDATAKQRLIPCAAFFGANASGKTNVLKAVGALNRLLNEGGPLAKWYDPNLLNPKYKHTTFEAEFIIDGETFTYQIAFDANHILEEVLRKNGKALYTIQSLKPVFDPKVSSSTYSVQKLTDILRVECSDGKEQQTKPFLHRIGLAYPGLNQDLRSAFLFFAGRMQYYPNEHEIPLPIAVDIFASTLNGDEDEALRRITEVVRRLDVDIEGIDIIRREIAPDERESARLTLQNPHTGVHHSFQITATHKDVTGKATQLDFMKHESAGTQRLAGLVGLILYTLETGGVLLVDELERSLHPLLMREVVMMFKKRRLNPKGAQLVVTTHNTDLLDDSVLRLSEISLVRKTKANGTLVRRLVDLKKEGEDIRNVTNFRKNYLAGFYSGIPHPAL